MKKGDILLVPHLPQYGLVTIVEATEDFDSGYKFALSKPNNNLGHIFPAKKLKVFNPHHAMVSGGIRKTLKARNRFWSVSPYRENIDQLINFDGALDEAVNIVNRFGDTVQQAFYDFFDRDKFSEALFLQLDKNFTAAEWESILVDGLQQLYPNYLVEHIGGQDEKSHGADILIRIPHPLVDSELGVAIQVKDYSGDVDSVEDFVQQISKADEHFVDQFYSLEKWLLFINIDESTSEKLAQLNDSGHGVRVLFREQVKSLFVDMSEAMVNWKPTEK